MEAMTKSERQELGMLIRKRERVMKSQAHERSAHMVAEFEAAIAKVYQYDEDPTWQRATDEARKVVDGAQAAISARCAELGIPAEFAPSLEFNWYGRGQTAIAARRAELRRVAKSRIEVLEREAITKIERLSLQAQTEVVAQGLESDAAKKFLESMPNVDTLMPPIQFDEIKSLIETRPAERRLGWRG